MSEAYENELDKHMELIDSWRKPVIWIDDADKKQFSKLGGLPMLPDYIEWPEWDNKPMSFIGQFDFSEFPENCDRNGLPERGVLYLFYDQTRKSWGFENQKGSWKTIYIRKSAKGLKEREAPKGLWSDGIFKEKYIKFVPKLIYPHAEDDRMQEFDDYIASGKLYRSVFDKKPAHYFSGHPEPFTQLAWRDDNDNDDWIVLLQIDTDYANGYVWEDFGMLVFHIKKRDLQKCNFDNTRFAIFFVSY